MKASAIYRIRLGACAALAATALISGAALAVAASSPATSFPVLADLGVGADARADIAVASPDASSAEALTLNQDAIKAAPMSGAAWLRVAYIRARNGRPLDAEALRAIERSYTVAPFGADVSGWRLTFLYEHWGELTPEIRAEATAEHLAMVGNQPTQWKPDGIANPSGRMAATFTHARALTIQAKTFAKKP